MAHCLEGIIAHSELLIAFAKKHALHAPIALTQGFSILPLRDEDIDSFVTTVAWIKNPNLRGDSFAHMNQALVDASLEGKLLYFQTDYFGGIGSQNATVFQDGVIAFGPKSAHHGPINKALALLGVQVAPDSVDEFATVGLPRYRHTEDLLETED